MSQSNYNRVDEYGHTIGQYDGRPIFQHERIIFVRNNILSLKWSYIGTIACMLILSVLAFASAKWIHKPGCGSQLEPYGVILWILACFTLLLTILPVLWWVYSYFRLEQKLDMAACNSHNINNNGYNMNDIEENNNRVPLRSSMNIHNNTTPETNEILINLASKFLVLYYIYHFIFNGVVLSVLGFISAVLVIRFGNLSCGVDYPAVFYIVVVCIGILYCAFLIVWFLAGLCTRTKPPHNAEKTSRNRLRSNYNISAFGNAWVVSPLVLIFTTILFPVLYFCRK